MDSASRRLELLKLEGLGFSQAEIVKESSVEEFHVKVAQNLDEACKLLEVGFEYVTDINGAKLFRKRK